MLTAFQTPRVDDGRSIQDHIVERAVQLVPEHYPWDERRADEEALRRALERDGFALAASVLRPVLPTDLRLPAQESEIERLLSKHDLATARGHLDQARDAHARGNWAAANAQIRTFLDALFDGLAEKVDPAAASVPSGQARRERLASAGFFSAQLNEWEASGKGFINGLIRRLHPEGAHPGLSGEDDSTFRLHLVMLTARFFLTRFDEGSGSP